MNTILIRFIMCSLIAMMFTTWDSQMLLSATPSQYQEKHIQQTRHHHRHHHKHVHKKPKVKHKFKVMKKETAPMKGITFGWIPIPNNSKEIIGEQPSYSYKVSRIRSNLIKIKLRFTKIAHYPRVFTSLQTRASNLQSYFCKDSTPPIIKTVNVDASKKEVTLHLTSSRNMDRSSYRYLPIFGGHIFQDTWLHFVAYDKHESSRAVSALASHLQ